MRRTDHSIQSLEPGTFQARFDEMKYDTRTKSNAYLFTLEDGRRAKVEATKFSDDADRVRFEAAGPRDMCQITVEKLKKTGITLVSFQPMVAKP